MLAETFKLVVARYNDTPLQTEKLWKELINCYSDKGRCYHTLHHLNHMLTELLPVRDEVADFDAILFALYYHDAVYDVLRNDNEEQSATLAGKRMISLRVSNDKIQACKTHILSTKTHTLSDNPDSNLFTDADLSILGQDWDTYATFCKQIRQEYSIYPDAAYISGRRKVLEHFLRMSKIFKTDHFHSKYEHQARINIGKELESYN